MSDLIIDFRDMTPSPEACLTPPPVSGSDSCSYTIPLYDEDDTTDRLVRFDRRGDQFVLSPANGGDTLTWAGSHANLSNVLTTVRVLHGMTQGTQLGRSAGGTMTLAVLAHYITTGQSIDPDMSEEEGRSLIASALLDVLTDSPEAALTALLGRLSVLRGQDWLDAPARERVRSIIEMTDLVPAYRTFRQNFLSESDFTSWDSLSGERQAQVDAIATFSRNVILANAFGQPLRYSGEFRAAEAAYTALHQNEISTGARPDFCAALETALGQLRGERGLPRNFLEDCRLASRLVDRPAAEAARETIRRDLLSSAGLRRLQEGIASESSAANMTVEWLASQGDDSRGGRIGEILEPLLSHLLYDPSAGDHLGLEVAPLIVQLNTQIDAQSTRRREFILASLAVMRRFFPEGDETPTVRIFRDGEFQEVTWQLTEEDRALLRQFRRSLESRVEISHDQSDLILPLVEGAVCALGVAGLLSSHLVPELGESPDLQLGLGTGSATLAGAGCTSLLGHFLWPAITNDVHNRYLWEGLTGLGGGIVAGGLYFLLSFFLRGENMSPGPGMRFPVDPFGP
ncbi:MAG TPA: hypothetical protein VJP40_07700 [bacterium]|nr:hypothetical protein [bacterium]